MPQLHERVGSQLVDSFLPKRERMRTPALPMSIFPENPRWQPGPDWNPEGSCMKDPPRLRQLPAPQKPQELCRRPHSEVRRSTGPKLHVHKRLTAPNGFGELELQRLSKVAEVVPITATSPSQRRSTAVQRGKHAASFAAIPRRSRGEWCCLQGSGSTLSGKQSSAGFLMLHAGFSQASQSIRGTSLPAAG